MTNNQLFRHYKGGVYKVIAYSLHESTHEELVTYQSLGDLRIWTRPEREFNQKFERMMIANNQLALNFAREVMGWEDANFYEYDSDGHNNPVILSKKYSQDELRFEDVGSVIDAVQRWCDEHDYRIGWTYMDHTNDVTIYHSQTFGKSGSCEHKDLSTALMTACLFAERQRIGAKGGE